MAWRSHHTAWALSKLNMFNNGEIPIFTEAGMTGVFFGGAIAGDHLPQLTYMVAHPSPESVSRNWQAFSDAPAWQTLRTDPQYRDSVSKIDKWFLRPTEASQV